MSFVVTAPDMVRAAAGNLASIGSTLGEAAAAAAGPTTSVAAAASDEVSVALSRLFGTYGQQFQALSAQAAAFHNEFVGLLNGGAAAYLNAEMANAAATDPILGGLSPILGGGSLSPILGGGSLSPILGGLSSTLNGLTSAISGAALGPILNGAGQEIGAALSGVISGNAGSLLSGLFAAGTTASQAGDPWQALFANTGANLQAIVNNWAADPFPVLKQVIINQNGYANTFGSGLGVALQNFPTTLANVPANVQLGIQGTSTFLPAMQTFINQQNAYNQTLNTSLQNAVADLQQRLPIFQADLAKANQALVTGDYHGAVRDVPQAVVDLMLSGINISNLSNVTVQGPAGDLLPALSVSTEQELSFVNLLPPGSIPKQIATNFVNATSVATGSLGFAVIGPPIATLDGLATGATAFGAALQTGNGVAAVGALVDMPAYVLNGFLNGNTVIDLTVPMTETVEIPAIPPLLPNITILGVGTPVVIHMPFEGILSQPQPITATLEVPVLGLTTIPLTFSFGGMQVEGTIPALLNYMPQQVAAAISPK
jgi:PE family